MQIRHVVYQSERGRERKSNEDGVLVLKRVPLFAVADGAGSSEAARLALLLLKGQSGHLAGRAADVKKNPSSAARLGLVRFFKGAFERANEALVEASAESAVRLTSTLVAATVIGRYLFIGHVGDSRAYLLRDGQLRCLTDDHTLAAAQLRRGDITEAELLNSPFRSTLSQAVGMSSTIEIDTAEVHLIEGDLLLLCTNGLHRFVDHDAITAALDPRDLERSSERLIDLVAAAGAPDNTTVLLVATEPDVSDQVSPEVLDRAVREVFLFRDLSDPEWNQVAPYLEETQHAANEVIRRAGEPSDRMAFVAHGAVAVQGLVERREIGPSGHFGTLGLVTRGEDLDTVTAIASTRLFVLTRERFEQLVRDQPALGTRLGLAVLESLGDRLGVLTTRLAKVIEAVHGQLRL